MELIEKIKEVELAYVQNSKYIHNMQSKKGKANIFFKDEPTNPHDKEAIQIFTLNRDKEEIFLGYIKKNDVHTIFTDEAEELYQDAQCHLIEWEDAKSDKNWGKIKEVIKEPIFTSSELEKIKELISKNAYRFRFEYDTQSGYIFLP